MNIQYKLVKEEHDKFKRFAAFDVTYPNEIKPLSIQQWLENFSSTKNNRRQRLLIQEITDLIISHTTSYKAYFFETKGVSMMNVSMKQFEFVLVNSRQLSTFCDMNGPTPEIFQEYLDECSETNDNDDTCCSFPNLGHTATLIAPMNLGNYSHIGKFMNNASKEEIYQMWKKITFELLNELNLHPSKSLWLSTSGLGVSWLHFRIDETPKYYTYRQFALET